MSDKLDAFVDQLQEQIFDEAREVFGDEGFDRWQHPRFNKKIENPDTHARVTGSCGDTIEISLNFVDDRVSEASYFTDGCGVSSVCGSFAAEMAIGKTVDEIADITGESILARLGKCPEEDKHCAFLAAQTLQEAVHNYMVSGR